MRRFLLIFTILDVPGWSQPSAQQPTPSPIVAKVEMAQERVWTSLTSLLHLHDTSNDCIWLNRTTCESVFKRPLAHSHFLSDDVVTRKRERRGGTYDWVDAAQDWSKPPACVTLVA